MYRYDGKESALRSAKVLGIAAFLLASGIGLTAHAASKNISQAEQNVNQADDAVKDAKSDVSVMESELEKMKESLADIEAAKGSINDYIEKLDKELTNQTQLVVEKETAVTKVKQDITETQEKLKEAEELERKQYELMKVRIKYMYENGDTDYFSILLGASSISDFLNRIEYVVELSSYDNRVLEQYQQTMDDIAELKTKLEEEKTTLESQLVQLQDGQDSLEYLIDAKQDELEEFESDADKKQALIDEYEADIQEQNDTIAILEQSAKEAKKKLKEEQALEEQRRQQEEEERKRQEEERKRQEEERKKQEQNNQTTTSGDTPATPAPTATPTPTPAPTKEPSSSSESSVTLTYDGGTFAWPCPAYTRISSEYGTRMHPTLGVEKFHNGVDLAAPAGSDILAAYKGTVIGAGYNSSMGNYVMIDHGSELYTIYMHASALYVKSGQNVSKGDVIAAVGTTGRSTGNHLHFGVRLNGSYVNPMNYIKK